MKKQFRVKKSKEIDAIINHRQSVGSKFFVIYYKESNKNHFRFAISIGKKYGKATQRNLIKRQIRMIFQTKKAIPSYDFVVVVRNNAKSLKFKEIKDNLENLINKTQETENKR